MLKSEIIEELQQCGASCISECNDCIVAQHSAVLMKFYPSNLERFCEFEAVTASGLIVPKRIIFAGGYMLEYCLRYVKNYLNAHELMGHVDSVSSLGAATVHAVGSVSSLGKKDVTLSFLSIDMCEVSFRCHISEVRDHFKQEVSLFEHPALFSDSILYSDMVNVS